MRSQYGQAILSLRYGVQFERSKRAGCAGDASEQSVSVLVRRARVAVHGSRSDNFILQTNLVAFFSLCGEYERV